MGSVTSPPPLYPCSNYSSTPRTPAQASWSHPYAVTSFSSATLMRIKSPAIKGRVKPTVLQKNAINKINKQQSGKDHDPADSQRTNFLNVKNGYKSISRKISNLIGKWAGSRQHLERVNANDRHSYETVCILAHNQVIVINIFCFGQNCSEWAVSCSPVRL